MSRVPEPAPDLRPFSDSLPMALLRAREAVMTAFRPHLHEMGVTEQQWRVLRALEGGRELTLGDLGRDTCISRPSLSRIVPALERRDLVARRSDDVDARRSRVRLKPGGEALIQRGAARSEAIYRDIEARIGSEHATHLRALLDRVHAALGPDRSG